MVGYITKSPALINRSLIEFVPELDSDYSKYPMKHSRWLEPNEIGPKGEPCFIKATATESDQTIKKDYTFCKVGPKGKGFYSLMCRVSYINLQNRIPSLAPASEFCSCFADKATRDALDRYDDCKRVIFMRQLCNTPNDEIASDAVMRNAQGTADLTYNTTQNEQLIGIP